jgi:hypothetical protein
MNTPTGIVRRAWSSVLVALSVVGCTGATESSPTSSISGHYSMTLHRAFATCSPAQLPTAGSSDTVLYAQIPASELAVPLLGDVTQTGSQVLLSAKSTANAVPTTVLWSGTYVPLQAVFERSRSRLEGPRSGGHTFFVSESEADTTQFVLLVQTPPGNRVEVRLISSGTVRAEFREGGSAGTLFTTCVYPQTMTGERLSP